MTDEQFSLDSFLEERDAKRAERQMAAEEREVQAGPAGAISAIEEDKPWLDLDDAAMFIPRAAEGFVRSIGSLLPGMDFGDSRTLGRSDTVIGAGLEGITQFGLGFLPALGVVGRVGQAARAGRFGAAGVKAAGFGRTIGGVKVAATATKAAHVAGGIKGGRFIMAATEGAAASGIADFVAFDGHEENLSAVLNSMPALAPFIPDFLATKEDEGEIINRMRNVLEGFGMGAALGTLVEGLRGIKAGRRASESAAGRTPGPAEVREAVTSSVDTGRLTEGLKEIEAKRYGPDPEVLEELGLEKAERAVLEEAEPTVKEAAPEPDPVAEPLIPGKGREGALSNDPIAHDKLLRTLTDQSEAGQKLYKAMRERRAMDDLSANPRKLTSAELAEQLLTDESSNFTKFLYDPEKGPVWLLRAFEDLGLIDKPPKLSAEEWAHDLHQQHILDVAAAEGKTYEETIEMLAARTGRDAAEVHEISVRARLTAGVNTSLWEARLETFDAAVSSGEVPDFNAIAQLSVGPAELSNELVGLSSRFGEALADVKQWNNQKSVAEKFADALREAHAEGSEVYDNFVTDWKAAMGKNVSKKDWLREKELSDMTFSRQVLVMTQEYFVNSILGGFKTLTIQPISGALLSVALPIEHMIGGALTGNMPVVKTAMRELTEYSSGFAESARWAWNTAKSNESRFGGEGLGEEARASAWAAGALGTKAGTGAGTMMDWLGNAIGMPGRLIKTADELTKQLKARATLTADFMDQATNSSILEYALDAEGNTITKGRARTQPEIDEFVQERLKNVFYEGQMQSEKIARKRAADEAIKAGVTDNKLINKHVEKRWQELFDPTMSEAVKRAEKSAKEVTLQSDFVYDSWEQKTQAALNSHPIMRFIVPFYKTPLNVAKFVGQRVPIVSGAQWIAAKKFDPKFRGLRDSQSRFIKDLMSGDPRLIAEANGRAATGVGLLSFGGGLAASGTITGRGPSNSEERAALIDAGWQPYSIKTDDGYVSYAKMDPFATFFGTIADFTDAMRLAGEDDSVGGEEVAIGMLTAFGNNFTEKSFLQGIGQFVEALGDPSNKMSAFVESYAGAVVPSSLAQMTSVFGDEAMKDTNGSLERIISRVPGMSDTATPRRNMFGEVVDRSQSLGEDSVGAFYGTFVPIAYREVSSDPIRQELASLKHGFAAPRASVQGVDLRDFTSPSGQHAHDRWAQLHGSVKVGGKTMRQTISNLINSRKYQKLTSESTVQDDSPRVQLLRSVLSRFRAKAFQQMLDEYPEAARAIRDREELTARRKRGLAAL